MVKNILIVDDHPFLRMGVRTFIEKGFEAITCSETDSVESTRLILEEKIFNFALVDISLADEDGLGLANFIKLRQPLCMVIVLSMHKEPLLVRKAIELKLDGYLIKEDAFDSLSDILSSGARHSFFLSKGLKDVMNISGKSETTGSIISLYNALTSREQTIFRLLGEGSNYKEIAVELGISQKTVLVHRYNLLKKMKIADQTELVKCGMKLGLIDSF